MCLWDTCGLQTIQKKIAASSLSCHSHPWKCNWPAMTATPSIMPGPGAHPQRVLWLNQTLHHHQSRHMIHEWTNCFWPAFLFKPITALKTWCWAQQMEQLTTFSEKMDGHGHPSNSGQSMQTPCATFAWLMSNWKHCDDKQKVIVLCIISVPKQLFQAWQFQQLLCGISHALLFSTTDGDLPNALVVFVLLKVLCFCTETPINKEGGAHNVTWQPPLPSIVRILWNGWNFVSVTAMTSKLSLQVWK